MKRELELFRKILLRIEETDQVGQCEDYAVEYKIFAGHLMLLDEAGFIVGIDIDELPDPSDLPDIHIVGWLRSTNAGHEFLSVSRDKTTWEKAKAILSDAGHDFGTVTLATLQALLVAITKKSLGL